jgi:hypothetical protein
MPCAPARFNRFRKENAAAMLAAASTGPMMRRFTTALLASCLLATSLAAVPVAAQAQGQPPHASLFGTWTGGVFPAPPNLSPQACLSQPVVIFTRDLVMRATLTEQVLTQREIETVRGTPTGLEFRFVGNGGTRLLGPSGPQQAGFGCETADVLHVQRRGENEISFPGCADFPNPLVRCQTR